MRLWAGDTISQFGQQLGMLAIPVLAVSVLHASEFQVGLLNTAETAAFLVIGLPAGAWVDRWRKRRVLITADFVRMATLLLIPLLWWTGLLQMWEVYAVGALIGAATVFFDVAYQSYIPILVAPAQVGNANSKLESTAQIASMAGPAAAGGLLSILTAPLVLFGTSIGYLASALFVWRIRDEEKPVDKATRQRLATEIAEGIRFVWKHPLLRRITATTAASNLFGTIATTMLPILVLRQLGLGPGVYGIMLSVASVGGLLGAISTPWLARRLGEGTLIPVSAITCGLALIPLPLAAMHPSIAIPLLVSGEFLNFFAGLVYNITQVTMRQRLCPPRLLGRMNASIRFVVWGVLPLGGIASGVLATGLGVEATLWIGAAGSLLAAGFVVFSPLLGMRTLPVEA